MAPARPTRPATLNSSYTFDDFIDVINPLQHLPIVSTLYRALTGDEISPQARAVGLPTDRIILSCKVSAVQDLIAVYRDLARACDYPLHLGLTEAGMGSKGIVSSAAAMAVLLRVCTKAVGSLGLGRCLVL